MMMFVVEKRVAPLPKPTKRKRRRCDLGYGRFLQVDPVGYGDQTNLYAYVASDPINLTDPTGTCGVGGYRWLCKIVYGKEARPASPEAKDRQFTPFRSALQNHFENGHGEPIYYKPSTWKIDQEDDHGITVARSANGYLGKATAVYKAVQASIAAGGRAVPVTFQTRATSADLIGNYTINWTGSVSVSTQGYVIDAVGSVANQPYDWSIGSRGSSWYRDMGVDIANGLGYGKGTTFQLIATENVFARFTGDVTKCERVC